MDKFKPMLIAPHGDPRWPSFCDLTCNGYFLDGINKDEALGFVASMLFTGKPLYSGEPVCMIEKKLSFKEEQYVSEILRLRRNNIKLKGELLKIKGEQ